MVIDKKSTTHEVDHALRHELEFKAEARRNKLLGIWAAEKMGITGDDVDDYASDVIVSDLEEPGINDVVRKVMGDFADKGVEITESRLREEMETLLRVARAQINTENG